MNVLHMCAKNDRNGNPRRVFVIVEGGKVTQTIDEGYKGEHALDSLGAELGRFLRSRIVGRFEVTPAEYRRLVKLGK